jgi:hypothetical protein
VFCKEYGSEEHPYSYSRCARCYVRKLFTEILTDPATGRVLSGMAHGQLPISHDPFREQFPMDRRHNYLRDLLTSTGVLPPYTPAIERIGADGRDASRGPSFEFTAWSSLI